VTNSLPQRFIVNITLPQISAEGRRIAINIANAPAVMNTPDGSLALMPHELTSNDILLEARNISNIPDTADREKAIFILIDSSTQLIRDAQQLARTFLQLADELEQSSEQLNSIKAALACMKPEVGDN
jgi:hypothetical protein